MDSVEQAVAKAVDQLAQARNKREAERHKHLLSAQLPATIAEWLVLHKITYARPWDLPRLIGTVPAEDTLAPDTTLSMGHDIALDMARRNVARLEQAIKREAALLDQKHWIASGTRLTQMHYLLAAERAIEIYVARRMALVAAPAEAAVVS